ncbi:MAG: acyl-CoA dehydrogenase family protein, partial [Acidimicrobiales bacterium]
MSIDFTLAPEHEAIRIRVRDFVTGTIIPATEGLDRRASRKEYLDVILGLREEAKGAGLWLPHMPEAWGGMGLGHVELAMVQA